MPRPAPADPVSLKAVALPAEHGGWGLLMEPILLGLVLAPTAAGLAVAVAAIGAFLLHHPLKLTLQDARRRTLYPRTRIAIRIGLAYLALAVGGLGAAWAAGEPVFLVPLALAIPGAAVQLGCGVYGSGRLLVAELVGAMALAATAPSIVLAGGLASVVAILVWAALAARAVGSIIYIRARLRRDRGLGGSAVPALLIHAGATAGVAGMAAAGLVSWPAVAAFAVLLARAGWGLSPWHALARPRTVGFQELGYGAVSTALFAIAFLA